MKNTGLNLELEKLHQDGTEWKFGALSEPGIIEIPLNQRAMYLPIGERQNIGDDKNDCATRSPINHLEIQFNYGYIKKIFKPENLKWLEDNGYIQDGRVVLSDRFIAVQSGTDPIKGNSLKAPIDTIHRKGLIPKAMFPQVPSRDEYYDKSKITNEMTKLGEEFLKRFTINYEQVAVVNMPNLLQKEMVGVAAYAWPTPQNQIYPRTDNLFNHAFLTFDPAIYAFDNYLDWNADNTAQVEGDFVKQLAKDYKFYDYGYRMYISKESIPKEEGEVVETVFHTLLKFGLIGFFADFIKRFFDMENTPPEKPVEVPKNDYLGLMCEAIKTHEGWFGPSTVAPRGSRSYRNNNPGNLRYAGQKKAIGSDDKNFAIFKTVEDGMEALRGMILNAARGGSKVYKPTMTLTEFFSVYAPSFDHNDPNNYARYVAKRMGVNANEFTLTQLL